MRKVFFDECGNTGQNLFDPADPIFTLAACSLDPEQEQRALSHFSQFNGPELKFSRLRKTPAGQRAVLAFLQSTEFSSDSASAVVFHKPYMVVAKYCDLVLEPSFQKLGIDFYKRGMNIAVANLLTTVMPVLLNKTTWANFLSLFVRLVRERTQRLHDEWRTSTELIYAHLEHAQPDAAKFFAPVLLMRNSDAFFATLGDDELDPLVPAYYQTVDHWGKSLGCLYEVIADESKVLAKARTRLLALADPSLKTISVGYDRRRMEFPLKVSDIVAVDSTTCPQVQLADIISGALTSAAKARTKGPLQPGTFQYRIFEAFSSQNVIFDGLWPSGEIDPSDLGTDLEPSPGEVDAATYVAMVLGGHPSTRKSQ